MGSDASLAVFWSFPISGMRCNISTKPPYCTLTDDLTAGSLKRSHGLIELDTKPFSPALSVSPKLGGIEHWCYSQRGTSIICVVAALFFGCSNLGVYPVLPLFAISLLRDSHQRRIGFSARRFA